MRSLGIDAHGGLDQLRLKENLAVPDIVNADDVRVRVVAAALNHLDLFVVAGIPGVKLSPDFALGSDGAGIIDAVGPEVRGVSVGDRVVINPGIVDRECQCEYCRDGDEPLCLTYGILGEHRSGTLAEYIVIPAANVRAIPNSIPFEEAAAFPLATLTAWRMMTTRAGRESG